MTIADLITQIDNKKHVEAEDTLNKVMANKISDAIETRKREVANTFVSNVTNTEVEDVPEDV